MDEVNNIVRSLLLTHHIFVGSIPVAESRTGINDP